MYIALFGQCNIKLFQVFFEHFKIIEPIEANELIWNYWNQKLKTWDLQWAIDHIKNKHICEFLSTNASTYIANSSKYAVIFLSYQFH